MPARPDFLCRSKESIAQLQPPVRSSVKDTNKTPAAVPAPAASNKGGKVSEDLLNELLPASTYT